MRKFIFLLVMFTIVISAKAQVRDTINGDTIRGIYVGQEFVSTEVNGMPYDYIIDVWYIGQYFNNDRNGICKYFRYTYNEEDSSFVKKDIIKLYVPLKDSLVGQSNKHWFDLNINETNARNYGWMFYFTYTER
jgi:hypothetical protein